MTDDITMNLEVTRQSANIDVEAIAPIRQFGPDSYDVANSTITATVNVPADGTYRLVLPMATEEGTSAFVRCVSATDEDFDTRADFRRITKGQAGILRPVLEKAGIPLEADLQAQLEREAPRYKVADIKLPSGPQVLRIHASQKLTPVDGNTRRYQFTIYAPQLSLAPVSTVRLGVTVVFPMDFAATVDTPIVEPLPGQPGVSQDAYHDLILGQQRALGWAFHADPKITISYTYA
ncbi:MAG TPA: hypothetical protein VGK17_24040 [Propionicimonas sp.]|jgi:hypothetical protein